MIKQIGKILGKLGKFETKHFYIILIIVLLFTGFSVIGLTKLKFESDFSKMDPQNLEIVKLNNHIDDIFDKGEATVILIEIDPHSELSSPIIDARDPRMIEFVKELDSNLRKNSNIEDVFSVGMVYPYLPETLEDSKTFLENVPGTERFFSKDYSFTFVNVYTDAGYDESKIEEINELINNIITDSGPPGGVKITVTGDPPLVAVMFNFLISDSFHTLIYAALFILILLFFLTRAIKKSFIIMIPLIFGLIWTAGTLGWFGIPITIATAGMSAMLLGLGVEYSIFLFSRYEEERQAGLKLNEAIIKTLSTTGASTMSSGLTTVIGFSVLTLSIFPMLADMGLSLAMGISYALLSTMVVLPLTIILSVKTSGEVIHVQKNNKLMNSIFSFFNSYGKSVSKRPWTMIIIFIGITALMFYGMQLMNNQDIDFDTVLPEGLAELEAYNTLSDQIAGDGTSSVNIFIEIDSTESGSNEPIDIRDPVVLNYIETLTQKIKYIDSFEEVDSLSTFIKEANNNIIPGSLRESVNILSTHDIRDYATKDYSGTIIRTDFTSNDKTDDEEILRQVYELIDTTEKPAGINVIVVGWLAVNIEVDNELNPDTMRTSLFAFIGIIILLLILSRSVKYTLLPLMTVVFAILWTLGFLGFFNVPYNSITSSILTMTIGIGIDFGLQLSMRFRQELEKREKRDAMRETLKNVLYPMSITVIAAVIGFQTMRLGNLKLMGDLGTSMSFSILSSMLVAITLVAGLIVIFERKKSSPKNLKRKPFQLKP